LNTVSAPPSCLQDRPSVFALIPIPQLLPLPPTRRPCRPCCLLSAATQILLKFLVRFSVKLIFIRLLGHNQIAEACTR